MTRARGRAPIPAVALEPARAAAALDCGESFFREQVLPEIRVIRRGAKVLVPVAELERWADANARRAA